MEKTSKSTRISDGSESGYVLPKDCPHVSSFLQVTNQIETSKPCHKCGDLSENWICLTCFAVSCSRFVKGHAVQHYEETHHPLSLSFSDLTFWCYKCNSYVKDSKFSVPYGLAHDHKFGKTTYEVQYSLEESESDDD